MSLRVAGRRSRAPSAAIWAQHRRSAHASCHAPCGAVPPLHSPLRRPVLPFLKSGGRAGGAGRGEEWGADASHAGLDGSAPPPALLSRGRRRPSATHARTPVRGRARGWCMFRGCGERQSAPTRRGTRTRGRPVQGQEGDWMPAPAGEGRGGPPPRPYSTVTDLARLRG